MKYSMSVWYKEGPGADWVKYGDYIDFWDMVNTIHCLRVALGDGALVKYF